MDENQFRELYEKHRPVQNDEELRWLINNVEKTNPKCILEIGVERGGTFAFWEQLLPPGGRLVGLDIQNIQTEVDIAASTRRITHIMADSHRIETLDRVRILLNGEPVDFLHIDGDHGYAGCKSDWSMYSTLVRPGGLVGFHDLGSEANNVGRFFRELAAQYPGQCEDGTTGRGQGCGVWWKR